MSINLTARPTIFDPSNKEGAVKVNNVELFLNDETMGKSSAKVTIVEPTAEELSDIAIAAADTAQKIAGISPKVALLSFSTKGSGNDDKYLKSVPKVQEAVKIAREKAPDLELDGEFQFDAAVAPEVSAIKAPDSKVAGHANVFVFPNINAGNIGYKIAQRMGGWMAIGPVCQGFAKPLNDLSRGCNVDDIVATVAVTALQA